MTVISFLILAVCFAPVWIPILIALAGRREPGSVRIVFGASGVLAGAYAAFAFILSAGGGGSFAGFELLFIPFRSAILSFYLGFTGVCLVTALHYVPLGRFASPPAVVASLLFVSCIVAGVLFAPWFFTWPSYD